MIKPSDLDNMAVQSGELADRADTDDGLDVLEHGEHKRIPRPEGGFDLDEDRPGADEDEDT